MKIEPKNAVGTTGRFLGVIKPKGATTEKFTEIYHTLVLDEWSEKHGGAYADLCYPVPKGHICNAYITGTVSLDKFKYLSIEN